LDVAQSLGFFHDDSAIGPLILALSDSNWDVQMIAASALGNINDRRPVGPLRQALNDGGGDVREAA